MSFCICALKINIKVVFVFKSCARDFLGNGWKAKLIISYAYDQSTNDINLDFEPSVIVKAIHIDCSLVTVPRNVPPSARKFRKVAPTYKVSHLGAKSSYENGKLTYMDHYNGIYIDHEWRGPTSNIKESRMEYSTNVYIPIPLSLFANCDTRSFDIEARAWVSVANRHPVELRTLRRTHFSNFVRICTVDGSMGCSLVN